MKRREFLIAVIFGAFSFRGYMISHFFPARKTNGWLLKKGDI